MTKFRQSRREMLAGLTLALAAVSASSALADTDTTPKSLNDPNDKPVASYYDPDAPVPAADPSMEILREQERFQYEYFLEHMGPYIHTVPFGETYPLSNIPEGIAPYVEWNGTMEVTVLAASLHPTIEDAQKFYDLGEVFAAKPGITRSGNQVYNYEYLVIQVQVSNIDAQQNIQSTIDNPYIFAINAFSPKTIEEMHDGTGYESLGGYDYASFDNAYQGVIPGHSRENRFELLPGETKVLTIGYWVHYSYEEDGTTVQTVNPANTVLRPELAGNPTAYGPIRFDLELPDYIGSIKDAEVERSRVDAS